MRVFLANTSLLPPYGGPAYSVSRLADALAKAGVEVGLWAPDQSAATTPLLSLDSRVQRLVGTEAQALESFGKVDILHDNGIWLSHHHRLARLASQRGIPRVVSTRGMLEPWALRHKRWKKSLSWRLYQRRDLKHAIYHHATALAEASNLEDLGLGVPVCVIPNGVDIPEMDHERRTIGGRKTAVFLGRIYPVKGLPMLVEAWARVRPKDWVLRIVGPDEAGHRREVEKAIVTAGLSDAIAFTGALDGHAKDAALFGADLFVLPTHSESFGMAIAEALAHALPVLTTTAAPWPMLAERGCGWWVDSTVEAIADALRQATCLDSATLRAMGAKGRELVIADFAWERVVKALLAIYGSSYLQ